MVITRHFARTRLTTPGMNLMTDLYKLYSLRLLRYNQTLLMSSITSAPDDKIMESDKPQQSWSRTAMKVLLIIELSFENKSVGNKRPEHVYLE